MKISHRKESSWGRIKTYINENYNVGDIIKRQTVKKNLKGVPLSTFDAYRNQLRIIGILELAGRGKYRLLHKIPEQMNTIVLWDLVNEPQWKNWFMPLEDRMERYLHRYD